MMLKTLIYAYSQGIYSSRRIEQCLMSDTAFMYLSGMQRILILEPFVFLELSMRKGSRIYSLEVVRLCASLGMVGLGPISFDGTKLKANASLRQTRNKESLAKEILKITEEIEALLKRAKDVGGTKI